MEIKTLAQLQSPDDRTLMFTPLGLGRMKAEDSADFQQQVIAELHLADDVAERTRAKFEQLRTAFAHGVLCYDLFTLVSDHARLTLEQALRDRFAAYYSGATVEVRDRARRGRPARVHQITVHSYRDFFEQYQAAKAAELRADPSQPWMEFNGMLNGLLAWARHEGLLRGQRNRQAERTVKALRNIVAHGEYHLDSPVEAARELSDLAEFINHLWGHPTPGGRLFPAPLHRAVVAIGWNHDGGTTLVGYAEQLAANPDEETFTYVLARAVHCPGGLSDPYLVNFDARHATTAFPTQWLWGPGSCEDAVAWLREHQPEPDVCDYLDQVVLLRTGNGQPDLPAYPAIAAGLPAHQQQGSWQTLRVDRGLDAFAHARALADPDAGHAARGECRACPVDTLVSGTLADALEAARRAGADTVPATVPDVRTPFADRYIPATR